MSDAGADAIFDFVDVGLPSTVCPEQDFRPRLKNLLRRIDGAKPEILVAEAGASPLEPYNVEAAVDELAGRVRATVLCASDPFAAVGVMEAFGTQPDLITGIGASTSAGIELIEKLTSVKAFNLLGPDARTVLSQMLSDVDLL